ncbi:MAG: MGMT family protein [Streptococcaceae bacterium]|nr:MGMT family protein [Streptococcaceae bacterium]
MVKEYSELKPETRAIIEAIKAVPFGSVSSYRDIAWQAGLQNGARQVVRTLHGLSEAYQLPWWRIIRADGRIGLPEPEKSLQIELLRAEKIEVTDAGRVLTEFVSFVSADNPLDPLIEDD